MWPKPYRNKTRQVMPNSVHEWKCSPEAANFTAAKAGSAPLLQSCERRRLGVGHGTCCTVLLLTSSLAACVPAPTTLTREHTSPAVACSPAHSRLPACLPPAALPPAEWRKKYGDDVSFFKWCREGLPEEVPQLQQASTGGAKGDSASSVSVVWSACCQQTGQSLHPRRISALRRASPLHATRLSNP